MISLFATHLKTLLQIEDLECQGNFKFRLCRFAPIASGARAYPYRRGLVKPAGVNFRHGAIAEGITTIGIEPGNPLWIKPCRPGLSNYI